LFGVSELEQRWLEQRKGAAVRVYVVWVPMLGAEERHVPEASRLATDSRVRQYWDGANILGEAYRSVLGLSGTAWDVYLLFGPDQTWGEDVPPKPVFWQHQLHGVTQAPTLDAPTFAGAADRLVTAAAARQPPGTGQ
jgi:hypothetical protein